MMSPCGVVFWTKSEEALKRYGGECDGHSNQAVPELFNNEDGVGDLNGESQSASTHAAPVGGYNGLAMNVHACADHDVAQNQGIGDVNKLNPSKTVLVAAAATQEKQLSNDVCAVSHRVQQLQRELQRVKLERGEPLEFVVKKRVQRTPGIRATRRLTIEQRDGVAVMVNRSPRGSERNVLRVCDIEKVTGNGALNITFRYGWYASAALSACLVWS
jgi:hypothetical protein